MQSGTLLIVLGMADAFVATVLYTIFYMNLLRKIKLLWESG